MNDQSGSLQDLHPIVSPEPVGLLPLAPGWQVLLAIIAFFVLWQAWKLWLKRRANQYRRQAIRELDQLDGATGIPDLLKRAALSAFNRQEIAALTGSDWHQFLDRSARMDRFTGSCGAWLDAVAYGDDALTADQISELQAAARTWLAEHRVVD